jgi:serine/threonine-protein kinase
LPVEPQQVVAKDKSPDNGSLVLNRNFILLLGISFGIITSLVVTALIYIFFITSVRNQPTQSPSQNALPRTAAPTTKISPKP